MAGLTNPYAGILDREDTVYTKQGSSYADIMNAATKMGKLGKGLGNLAGIGVDSIGDGPTGKTTVDEHGNTNYVASHKTAIKPKAKSTAKERMARRKLANPQFYNV